VATSFGPRLSRRGGYTGCGGFALERSRVPSGAFAFWSLITKISSHTWAAVTHLGEQGCKGA
jgi:hypothetical protein